MAGAVGGRIAASQDYAATGKSLIIMDMLHTAFRHRSAPAFTAPRRAFACDPIRKGRAEDLSEIERLALKAEPKIAQAVLAALKAQQSAVDMKALIAALKTGSSNEVMAVLNAAFGHHFMAGVAVALMQAVASGGALGAAHIVRMTKVEFRFGVLNPRLVSWLQSYSLGLIKQINEATKEGVRTALVAGMQSGKNPVDTARQVRQVVGLTSKQAKAVQNYRKELETFHLRRSADGFGLGSKIDRVNGRQVFRPDEDGSPKDGIDERRLRDFRFDGHLKRALEQRKPIPPAKIDEMVEAYSRKYLKYRSEVIAKTEAMRTTNAGVQDAWRQAIDAGTVPEAQVRRQWMVGADERVCSVCAPIPGMNPKRGVKFGQPFATPNGPVMLPPLHPQCLPAGTLVTATDVVTGATMRWYEGDLVVILTSEGKKLSGTPNHPVLTDRGWVALGGLYEGDNVICRPSGDDAIGHEDDQDVPSAIEDIARAAFESGKMSPREVPLSAEDFHGDGRDGEIAVIASDRKLWDAFDSAISQHAIKSDLDGAAMQVRLPLAAHRDPANRVLPFDPPARCGMCGGDLGGSRGAVHAAPLDKLGLALPAQSDAGLPQDPRDDVAADAELARQIIDGSTGPVLADKVVKVERIPFAGHVFNLETTRGHYTANGVICHNCRCTVYVRQWEPAQLASESSP